MKLLLLVSLCFAWGLYGVFTPQPKIKLVSNEAESLVEVRIGGELFTSYRYGDPLKKPVLWPVVSANGAELTRHFPFKIKVGERIDHQHHVGIWFNYGDINGLDFWNNSTARSPEKAAKYGSIVHEAIERSQDGKREAILETRSSWQDFQGQALLAENTQFRFWTDGDTRIIDRRASLEALVDSVRFSDNKEGMFAIRLTRELELPAQKPASLSNEKGEAVRQAEVDNSAVTGDYLSSEGKSGSKVWGTRASWMKLNGTIGDKAVAIVIYDHPDNAGYPTYWHARGYGLFAANPLGQKVFSKGERELNFHLLKGDKATFQYRLAVFSHDPSLKEIEKLDYKTSE
ncbi:MAG: PmoA family protein [Bacteroidia bacterium]